MVLCTCFAGGAVYRWYCVHVVHVVLCACHTCYDCTHVVLCMTIHVVFYVCGVMYMLYIECCVYDYTCGVLCMWCHVHVIHRVLCARGVVYMSCMGCCEHVQLHPVYDTT